MHNEEFDIDVDLSSAFGLGEGDALIDSRWFELAHMHQDGSLHDKAERMFKNALMKAQWQATQRRALDRRTAIRVPCITRVHLPTGGHMVATDLSLSGMRCTGEPTAPVMNVEFKVPGLHFPINTKVEVMSYKDSPLFPFTGLRFVNMERAYRDFLAAYIGKRRQAVLAA